VIGTDDHSGDFRAVASRKSSLWASLATANRTDPVMGSIRPREEGAMRQGRRVDPGAPTGIHTGRRNSGGRGGGYIVAAFPPRDRVLPSLICANRYQNQNRRHRVSTPSQWQFVGNVPENYERFGSKHLRSLGARSHRRRARRDMGVIQTSSTSRKLVRTWQESGSRNGCRVRMTSGTSSMTSLNSRVSWGQSPPIR
jgi:hypothetical protein